MAGRQNPIAAKLSRTPSPRLDRRRLALALALILLPVCVFYGLLASQVTPIPMQDDMSVLVFGSRYVVSPGLESRLHLVFFAQHNEYKLIFENGVYAAMLSVTHRLNFVTLCHLGNAFVLLVFAAIALSWRQRGVATETALLRLAPIALLLFQLQYWETVDWAMAGLQNIPVIAFSLFAIYLLTCRFAGGFALAALCMLLAICSSGNGFVMVLVGVAMLWRARRIPALLAWIALAAVMFWVYARHYVEASQVVRLPRASLLHKLGYLLSSIGASIGIPWSNAPAILFGTLLLAGFFLAAWRGYERRQPAIFYSMAFLLLTAFLLTLGRGDFPVFQSASFRYRIYSNLWMMFLYIFLSDEIASGRLRGARRFLPAFMVFSILFCASGDLLGLHYLRQRRGMTFKSMAAWERTQCGLPAGEILPRQTRLLEPDTPVMLQAIEVDRTYSPPILDPCFADVARHE